MHDFSPGRGLMMRLMYSFVFKFHQSSAKSEVRGFAASKIHPTEREQGNIHTVIRAQHMHTPF